VVCSIVPVHSDAFKPTSAAIKLPRTSYYTDNEEVTYTELLDVCDEVTLTITEEEVKLTNITKPKTQLGLCNMLVELLLPK